MSNQTTKFRWWADFLLSDGHIAHTYNPQFFDSERQAWDSLRSVAKFRNEYGNAILKAHAVEPVAVTNRSFENNLRAM